MALTDNCCRNPGSRIGHVFFITAFLLVIGCSVASLLVFVLRHNEIQRDLPDESDGDCILYVSDDQIESDDIGGGGFCRFAIYGSGAVALGTAIYLLGFIVKCVVGSELLTCLILVEIPLLFCIMAVSLAHSLNTAIGLALTCKAFADTDRYDGSCKGYEIPGDSGTKFFRDILISEAISWAATGTLMILFVVYVVMAVAFWRKGTRADVKKRSTI